MLHLLINLLNIRNMLHLNQILDISLLNISNKLFLIVDLQLTNSLDILFLFLFALLRFCLALLASVTWRLFWNSTLFQHFFLRFRFARLFGTIRRDRSRRSAARHNTDTTSDFFVIFHCFWRWNDKALLLFDLLFLDGPVLGLRTRRSCGRIRANHRPK